MHKMDGIAAAVEIREENSLAEIIMMTNYSSSSLKRAANSAGIKYYFKKEEIEELIKIIKEIKK